LGTLDQVLAPPWLFWPLGGHSGAWIDCLKPGAIVVNVARGALLDQQVLIRNLAAPGGCAGPFLTFFDEEPLPVTSPLWGTRNVLMRSRGRRLTATLLEAGAGTVPRQPGAISCGPAAAEPGRQTRGIL